MPVRYSKRLDWSTTTNALTLELQEAKTAGRDLLDLTQSNPTAAGIAYPPVHEYLSDPGVLSYEPTAQGAWTAREAVSNYYGGTVSPDRLLLTASTSEAYSYLFKLLCDPGDEVLVARPSYPLFEMLGHLESVTIRQYALHYHDFWFIDMHALRRAITSRTRAIVWVNPNNPTGSFLKRQEYEELAELCAEHDLALISDEVFKDYAIDPEPTALPTLTNQDACLTFSLSGLSKVCGLPQMKLGWIAATGPGHQQAIHRLEWIADTFLSVGTPVQSAAPALLDARHGIQDQIRERTITNWKHLLNATRDTPCQLLRVEAGWYAVLKVPHIRSEEEWALYLLRAGVLVQPGFFFDFESEAFLILSLLTHPEIFQSGLRHILDAC